jgi:hypothetical protein
MKQAHELDDRELNIAIAESRGFEWSRCVDDKIRLYKRNDDDTLKVAPIPNTTTDLNAIHEVEKELGMNGARFRDNLHDIVDRDLSKKGSQPVWSVHATARQRSEAFYNTVIYKP